MEKGKLRMKQNRNHFSFETGVVDVRLNILHTDEQNVFIQLFDYKIDDQIYSAFIRGPLMQEELITFLDAIQAKFTVEVIEFLTMKYVCKKYEVYKIENSGSNFDNFLQILSSPD